MSPKHNFLRQVAFDIEAAEKTKDVVSGNDQAKALRELRDSLERFPDEHAFFQMWQKPESIRF